MGIYDRDYYKEEPQGWFAEGARSMVVNLIIINIGVYLAQILFRQSQITDLLALSANIWSKPWLYWKLLSAGFAHDPDNVFHVIFNMYFLWLFGRDLEITLGKKEFLCFYLSTIVLANAGWMASQVLIFDNPNASAIGASGGVMGVAMLFACRDPHRTFYFWFVPVPVWVMIGIMVLKDFKGFADSQAGLSVEPIAYEAHLCGALAGFIYFRYQWHLGNLIEPLLQWRKPKMFRRGPKLRVHREAPAPAPRDDWEGQMDHLLDKIQQHGEASLTDVERATLEEASRRLRQRKR